MCWCINLCLDLLILSCGKSFSFGVFISGFVFLVKNFSVCVSIKSLILGNSERSLKYCVFVYRGTLCIRRMHLFWKISKGSRA
jgi:hypothetical protein